jgi:poly(3-hydroxybutyrate) depolymerase
MRIAKIQTPSPLCWCFLIGLGFMGCSESNDSTQESEPFLMLEDASVMMIDASIDEVDAEFETPAPMPAPPYLGGERPAIYALPYGYEPDQEMPLIISMHGFTGTGAWHDLYWGLSDLTRELGILLIMPNGRTNPEGAQFWSATDACCNFAGAADTDDQYIRGLIEEAQLHFNVDPKRIAVMGHSNGGFMSYRMACDHADLITHVGALAGSSFFEEGRCAPARPVSIFNIHGTWDLSIRYTGRSPTIVPASQRPTCEADACGEETETCTSNADCQILNDCIQICTPGDPGEACRNICFGAAPEGIGLMWTEYFMCSFNAGCYDSSPIYFGPYPSAEENVAWWAANNECAATQELGQLNLDNAVTGRETIVTGHTECNEGTDIRLGRIERGSHGPALTPAFSTTLVQWVLDTPRSE